MKKCIRLISFLLIIGGVGVGFIALQNSRLNSEEFNLASSVSPIIQRIKNSLDIDGNDSDYLENETDIQIEYQTVRIPNEETNNQVEPNERKYDNGPLFSNKDKILNFENNAGTEKEHGNEQNDNENENENAQQNLSNDDKPDYDYDAEDDVDQIVEADDTIKGDNQNKKKDRNLAENFVDQTEVKLIDGNNNLNNSVVETIIEYKNGLNPFQESLKDGIKKTETFGDKEDKEDYSIDDDTKLTNSEVETEKENSFLNSKITEGLTDQAVTSDNMETIRSIRVKRT